jgi:hypothetical protein
MRVLALLTLLPSAAAFSTFCNMPPRSNASVQSTSLNMQNRKVVRQEQIERGLIVDEIRKNGIQNGLPERPVLASIQDEAQEPVATFATDQQAAAAQAKKQKLKVQQQVQEALRYFEEKAQKASAVKKATAAKKASPLKGLLNGLL